MSWKTRSNSFFGTDLLVAFQKLNFMDGTTCR